MPGSAGGRAGETGTVGEVVDGRYRIVGLVGIGAMGCVYRAETTNAARDATGDGQVAIKLLHPEVGKSEELARRFEREAMATARVAGAHCVAVKDFGALADGRLYLAMELLRGRSLADELERAGRLSPPRALAIAADVARGLERAHGCGVLHRDLKPENIFLTRGTEGEDEIAKILDFGLAKLVGDSAAGQEALTRAGFAMGTPTYMAPEWIWRQGYDERGDLYALSVILYELITGAPPFRAEERTEVLRMHAQAPVPPLREVAPDAGASPALEALLAWGLEKQPEDRIPDAATYRERAERLLSHPDASAAEICPERAELAQTGAAPAPADTGSTALMFGLPDSAAKPAPRADAGAPAPRTPAAPPTSSPSATQPGHAPIKESAAGADEAAPRSSEAENQAPGPEAPKASHDEPGPAPPDSGEPAENPPPPPSAPALDGFAQAPRIAPRGAPGNRSWSPARLASAGLGLALLAAVAVAAALAQTGDGESGGAAFAELAGADFEVGGFAPASHGPLAGRPCEAGAAGGVPIVICAHGDREAAASTEEAAEAAGIRGRVVREGTTVIVIRPAPDVDPDGERAAAIIDAFRPEPGDW